MIFRALNRQELELIHSIDISTNKSPWSLHSYQESLENHNHSVIGLFDDKGELIGGCVYSIVLDEAEILQIVISKLWQGNGYGYLLLNHICDTVKSKNASQIFLEVMLGNTSAINLYHKSGFNIIGKRKNYYKVDGKLIDAILMAKTFFDFGSQ